MHCTRTFLAWSLSIFLVGLAMILCFCLTILHWSFFTLCWFAFTDFYCSTWEFGPGLIPFLTAHLIKTCLNHRTKCHFRIALFFESWNKCRLQWFFRVISLQHNTIEVSLTTDGMRPPDVCQRNLWMLFLGKGTSIGKLYKRCCYSHCCWKAWRNPRQRLPLSGGSQLPERVACSPSKEANEVRSQLPC